MPVSGSVDVCRTVARFIPSLCSQVARQGGMLFPVANNMYIDVIKSYSVYVVRIPGR